jgi:diguanylate cyclase (GGDEF)-like protein
MKASEARKINDFHVRLAERSANTTNLHSLIETIIQETVDFIEATSGSIMVFDPPENCLKLYVSSSHPRVGKKNANGPAARVSTTSGIAGKVFSCGKPIIVKDIKKADTSIIEVRHSNDSGSFLSLPLKASNRMIGVMNFNREQNLPGFCEDDLMRLTMVGATIASLIDKERLLETIDENRLEISGLYDLSQILTHTPDFYQALKSFLERLSEQLSLEKSAILRINSAYESDFSANSNEKDFKLLASHNLELEQLKKMFLSVSSRLQNQINRTWQPFDTEKSEPEEPLSLTFIENGEPKELFCLPLVVEEQPSHLLLVSRRYLSEDIEQVKKHYRFLYLISQSLGMSIERHRMVERIKDDQQLLLRTAARNQIFLEISKDLASTLDPYVILQKAFNRFSSVIEYTSIAILLFDDLDNSYRIIVQPSRSISKAYQKDLSRKLCEVFDEYPSDPPVSEDNLNKPVIFKPQEHSIRPAETFLQSLHLPVIIGDRVAGLIHLAREQDEPFTNTELDITSQFTGIFITSIKNALIHKRTEKLAFTDPLTSLFNHRYFQETLSHELIRAKRYKKPLSLMVIDIDFFKKFNDTYGHLTGDKVLRHVARIFKNSVREQIDTVARYGGEEFGVILPETSLEGAEQFAERIRSSVENTKILEGDQELSITLSIGVACTEVTDCDKTSDLIEAADIALYQAKDDGRNQVKTYKESTIHNGIKE